ncbi:hypothetical protein ACHAXS_011059 [Conticribra weissflogii]
MKFPQVRRPKLIDRTDVFTDDLPYDVWPIPPPITAASSWSSSSSDLLPKTNETDHGEPGQNATRVRDPPSLPSAERGDFAASEGQTCFVSNPSSPLPKRSTAANTARTTSTTSFSDIPFPTQIPPTIFEHFVEFLPVSLPLLAFSTYEMTAEVFDQTVEFISNNNWVAVDGGQYQANIITPAINGLVVPSIALLFATLVSNTINTLRQRQLQIRTSLNIEANDMRMLSTMVDSLPMELQKVKNHLREYLIQYSSRIIGESKPGLSVDNHMFIGSMDHEMNGFLMVLNKLSMCTYGTVYANTMQPPVPHPVSDSDFRLLESQLGLTPYQRHVSSAFLSPPMFSEAYDALPRLRNERSTRLLIGTFSALGVVNYDMIDPFRGRCEFRMGACCCYYVFYSIVLFSHPIHVIAGVSMSVCVIFCFLSLYLSLFSTCRQCRRIGRSILHHSGIDSGHNPHGARANSSR